MMRTFQNVRNSFPDTIREFRSPLVLISVKGPHHPVLIGFPTLVARTYTVCRLVTSFRARGQSRVHGPLHWTRTYPAAPHGGRNHVADSRAYTGLRWPGPALVPGPTSSRHSTSPAKAPPLAELTKEHGIEPRTKRVFAEIECHPCHTKPHSHLASCALPWP
jgi:hypothetical protein